MILKIWNFRISWKLSLNQPMVGFWALPKIKFYILGLVSFLFSQKLDMVFNSVMSNHIKSGKIIAWYTFIKHDARQSTSKLSPSKVNARVPN